MVTSPARKPASHSPFGRFLYACLEANNLTLTTFARKVEASPGFISSIATGRKHLPEARIEHWAQALRLRGIKRQQFRLLTCLESATPLLAETLLENDMILTGLASQGAITDDMAALDLIGACP